MILDVSLDDEDIQTLENGGFFKIVLQDGIEVIIVKENSQEKRRK